MAEGDNTWLSSDDYDTMLRAMPIVSVDLIVNNERGRVLLGKRRNRPAAGHWFVPGGRLFKGEDIDAAVRRISRQETGQELAHVRTLGVYHQRYPDNFRDGSYGCHYVTFAVSVVATGSGEMSGDDQHEEFRWWDVEELMASRDVHEVAKNYFSLSPKDKILP